MKNIYKKRWTTFFSLAIYSAASHTVIFFYSSFKARFTTDKEDFLRHKGFNMLVTCSHNPEFQFNLFRKKGTNRPILHPLEGNTSYKKLDEIKTRLNALLLKKVHPKIYGHAKDKDASHAILKIWSERLQNKTLIKGDFKQAYMSADLVRFAKFLRKKGVLEHDIEFICKNRYYARDGTRLSIRGLPQGFCYSPICFAAYMTPFMTRLCRRYDALLYVDDLFIFLKPEDNTDEAKKHLELCIRKHRSKK